MRASEALQVSALFLPIATDHPYSDGAAKKVNSILRIRRRKDTLTFGNVTGAMVFQGTILPAIGIMLTP